ncbi:hypothetical protein D3C85_1883850 [compost metagenome]
MFYTVLVRNDKNVFPLLVVIVVTVRAVHMIMLLIAHRQNLISFYNKLLEYPNIFIIRGQTSYDELAYSDWICFSDTTV